jgi:hypothetical protein
MTFPWKVDYLVRESKRSQLHLVTLPRSSAFLDIPPFLHLYRPQQQLGIPVSKRAVHEVHKMTPTSEIGAPGPFHSSSMETADVSRADLPAVLCSRDRPAHKVAFALASEACA